MGNPKGLVESLAYEPLVLIPGPVMYEDDEKLAETLAGPGISYKHQATSLKIMLDNWSGIL